MGRKPGRIGGETLTARILNLACRLKAQRLGIAEYTLPQLAQDSKINHTVIIRAVGDNPRRGPTLTTVKKLAETLEVSVDSELEDRFYNAFGYASPRQLAEIQPYVEHKEGEDVS